jgi:hypothetical protein
MPKERKRDTGPLAAPVEGNLHFSTANWVLLTLGVAAIVAGYVLLARGDTVAAPLLLMLGYLVLVPWGIIR